MWYDEKKGTKKEERIMKCIINGKILLKDKVAENMALIFGEKIEKIVLFRWNRHYPADVHFQFPGKWHLVQTEDFPGSSHEKITMEVYERCE